jgi:hypothetical protein
MELMLLSPLIHLLSNHRLLSSHAAAAGQEHMASTAAHTAGSLTHTPHTQCFMSQLELTVYSTGILERIKNFTIPKALCNYQAVMYLKKEIIISFFIITISASNLYMPMI